ncbi:MAG: response regulator transcription factor [Arcobacter sp.]|uniref:response regulator transcription factor n=1 Tax=Arcobacter sp. TaxID=1872629 RepID=UPI003B00987D
MENFEEYKQNIKILCIEDEFEASMLLKRILSKYYKEIILAKNGEEALEIYRNSYSSAKPIDLVISDINMPKMDGIELLEMIRQFDEYLPFIYVTAKLDVQVLLKLVKLEIINYIQKPVDVDELLRSVDKVVLNKYKSHFFNSNHKEELIYITQTLKWDDISKDLIFKDESIKLTKYELKLVDYLLSNFNRVITMENIIDEVWEDSLSNSNSTNLKNLISRLKVKVPELHIENIYGLGYKIRVLNG